MPCPHRLANVGTSPVLCVGSYSGPSPAMNGGAGIIVSHNVRDFAGSELRFPDVRILRPAEFLKEMK